MGSADFKRIARRALVLLAVSAMLAACGGGGSKDTEPQPPMALLPVIQEQPAAASVVAGRTAEFKVVAQSEGAAQYQWKRNGVAIPGETASTLYVPALSVNADAQFSVTVTNRAGTVESRPAVLTLQAPQVPALQAQVDSAALKSTVTLADGLLERIPGSDTQFLGLRSAWAVGQAIVFAGQGQVVTSVEPDTLPSRVKLTTRLAAIDEIYEHLKLKATVHQVAYQADGRPVAAAVLRTGRGARAMATGQAKAADLDLSCVRPAREISISDEEFGYEYKIDCGLADLLQGAGVEAPGNNTDVRFSGTMGASGKHIVEIDDDKDIELVTRSDSVKGEVAVAVSRSDLGDLTSWLKRLCENYKRKANATLGARYALCEVDASGGKTKLDFAVSLLPVHQFFLPLPPPAPPLPMYASVGFIASVEFSANGGIVTSYHFSKSIKAGVDRGGRVFESPPVVKHQLKVEPTIEGTVEAMVGGFGAVGIGHLAVAAIEAQVSVGPYGSAAFRLLPSACVEVEAGFQFGVFLRLRTPFFSGLNLMDETVKSRLYENTLPQDCEWTSNTKADLHYSIAGRSKYSYSFADSSSGHDVFNATYALIARPSPEQAKLIRLDLGDTTVPKGQPLQFEYANLEASRGVEFNLVHRPETDARPYLDINPGATSWGDTIRFRLSAFVPGQRESTESSRIVEIRIEQRLAAAPTWYSRVDTDGMETMQMHIGLLAETASRMTGGKVIYDDGSEELLGQQDGGYSDPLSIWTNICLMQGWDDCPSWVRKRPSRLVLFGAYSREGYGQEFEFEHLVQPIVTRATINPDVAGVGDRVNVQVEGLRLPEDFGLTVPQCVALQEQRTSGNIRYRNFASEYREFNCTAAQAGKDLLVTVLSGQAVGTLEILGYGDAPQWVATPSPAIAGQAVSFKLTAPEQVLLDWVVRTRQVIWEFGQGVAQQVVRIADGLADLVAEVIQAFLVEGITTVRATFIGALDVVLGASEGSLQINAPALTAVDEVTPLHATAGLLATFDVKGQHLPDGLRLNIDGCTGSTELMAIASKELRRFTCTFPADTVAGLRSGTVALGDSPFTNPPLKSFDVQVNRVLVDDIAPKATVRTLASSFEVSGQNLPTTGITVVPVPADGRSNCQAPHNLTANGFGVACELFNVGAQTLEVRHGGSNVLGTVQVNVASNVTRVSWTSPSTQSSGTVRLGDSVVFTVHGENLLADPVMGFAVELCGVSNTPTGTPSATARQFTCTFNPDGGAVAGLMTGVVKDKPDGQVLFGGPANVVQAFKVPVDVAAAPSSLSFQERPDTGSGWNLKVTITPKDANGNRGSFDFGLGQCTGTLTYKGKDGGGHHVFQENHLTGNCLKTCDIVIAGDASFYNERCVGGGYGGNNISPVDRRWIQPAPTGAQLQQLLGAAVLTNPANGRFYEVIECGTWTACRDSARARGGELVTVRSAAEHAWLIENLLPMAKNEYGLWIGLTDEGQEGVWRWTSGEAVAFTNWRVGEPNNFYVDGRAENYVHMWKGNAAPTFSPGVWNDIVNEPLLTGSALSIITQAIVEYPPARRVSNPANGRTYEVITCGTWVQCRDAARARGGELVTIRSRAENDWLSSNVIPLVSNTVWLGYEREGQVWRWSSGEPATFTNWLPGEPNNHFGNDNCVQTGRASLYAGRWNDNLCDHPEVTQAIVEYPPGRM